MSRWIRVQVDIHEHSVFAPEAFTEREAWQWMIGRAAWKETAHRVGAAVHRVPVGSFFATIREMQAVWKWTSTRRVAQFLELLASQNMIETCSETGKTLVTVCNYSRYQNAETPSETPDSSKQKQERNTKDTNTPSTNTSSSLRSEGAPPPSDFEKLWSIYPHKVGKPVAEKAFAKALKRASFEAILAGLRRYVAKTDDRPWCNLSTWLNQDRWADAPAPAIIRQQPQAPPGRKSEFQQRQDDIYRNLKRQNGETDDQFTGPTLDLAERDYRPH